MKSATRTQAISRNSSEKKPAFRPPTTGYNGKSLARKLTGYFFRHQHLPQLADDAGVPLVERFPKRKQKHILTRRRHSQPILMIRVAKKFQRGLADVLSGKLKIAIFLDLRGNTDRGFAWLFNQDDLMGFVRHVNGV